MSKHASERAGVGQSLPTTNTRTISELSISPELEASPEIILASSVKTCSPSEAIVSLKAQRVFNVVMFLARVKVKAR